MGGVLICFATLCRDVNISIGGKHFGKHETQASSSSWQSTESLGQQSDLSFSLKIEPEGANQEREGITLYFVNLLG